METVLSMHEATRASARSLVGLRDSLARWQLQHGIQQWEPGEVGAEDILAQIDNHEWYLDAHFGSLRAAVRITEIDTDVWPHSGGTAGYIHGLMVSRDFAGVGLGIRVLSWVEQEIISRSLEYARLDCVATNAALREYYRMQGFQERGIVTFDPETGWHPVMRFEKVLS